MNATPTNQFHQTQRTWRFPRLLLEDHIALALMIWAGFVAIGAVLAIGGFLFPDSVIDIDVSGWEIVAGIAPWYVAIIGGHVFHQAVPMLVAHGRTRRNSAIEAVIFTGVFSAVVALLITAGFALEHGLYTLNDWSRGSPNDHLYASYTDYVGIFAEYWLSFLVWAAAGGLVGAAIYREPEAGWFALVPATGLIAISGLTRAESGQPMGFIMNRLPETGSTSLALTALLSLISFLIAIGLAWLIIRDTPLRNR